MVGIGLQHPAVDLLGVADVARLVMLHRQRQGLCYGRHLTPLLPECSIRRSPVRQRRVPCFRGPVRLVLSPRHAGPRKHACPQNEVLGHGATVRQHAFAALWS